jgi:hypothetical protein
MKRIFVSLLITLMVACHLIFMTPAQASPLLAATSSTVATQAKSQEEFLEQLKTQLLPQLESILTPEQRDQIEAAMAEGKTSLRKVFKSIALTPEQKTKLATVFKSSPAKDAFASMTPEQKKQLFMKKKEFFMPTPEEITEKISAGMEKKSAFMPSLEEISQKISTGLKMMTSKLDN